MLPRYPLAYRSLLNFRDAVTASKQSLRSKPRTAQVTACVMADTGAKVVNSVVL
jgi:hypothetical protein